MRFRRCWEKLFGALDALIELNRTVDDLISEILDRFAHRWLLIQEIPIQ